MLQSLLLSSSLTSSETLYDLTSTTCSREMFEILHTLGVDTERILFIKNLVYRGISYYSEQCVIFSNFIFSKRFCFALKASSVKYRVTKGKLVSIYITNDAFSVKPKYSKQNTYQYTYKMF